MFVFKKSLAFFCIINWQRELSKFVDVSHFGAKTSLQGSGGQTKWLSDFFFDSLNALDIFLFGSTFFFFILSVNKHLLSK